MIRSLRKKFIIFAMAAVTVLLLVLGIAINVFAWIQFERQADAMMNIVVNSEGTFMRMRPKEDDPPKLPPPNIDIMRSARFFMVKTDEDGNSREIDIDQIFYVSKEQAEEYARAVLKKGADSGRIDRYKYAVKQIDDGKMIYFLDMTREQLTIRTIIYVSCIIASISWLIALLFVIFLSGKVVRPIIEGFEKQKRFITNAGHELKTPLAIIQSNNDAMSLIHGENKYNRNIKAQVTRLSDLTSNLLMQARLDEEVELKKEKLNLSEMVSDIIKPYADSFESRGIKLQADITPDVCFSTNREAFTQMVNILMDNALKYTTENGSIMIALRHNGNHVLLVEENTCEIDTDIDPERLFDRFYRGDSARTQKDHHSGYGIGLSVARSISENLGGKLTAVYSEQGKIRFTISL